MVYVLDANVVSALRIRGRHPAVEHWASLIPVADLFVTAISMAEIERGVVARERSDPQQGSVLRRWFDDRVLPAFHGRVLSFDLAAARILAAYRVPARAPLDDAIIAATAAAHDMVVVTRNVRHFAHLDVPVINPWDVPSDVGLP